MSRLGSLGEIRIDLVAGTARFTTDVATAQKVLATYGKEADKTADKTNAWAKAAKLAGAAVIGFTAGLAAISYAGVKAWQSLDAAAEKVDQIGKASKRLGIPVQELSALRFAAGEAGVEFETLAKSASKALQTFAKESNAGKTWERVGELNIQIKDAAGNVRTLSDLLPDLARGIESAGSEAEQLQLAQKFFGREGGDQFVQLLKESGSFVENLATQAERARRLGVIFTDEQVDTLTAYRDAVGRIDEAWLGLRVNIITRIAPTLEGLANQAAAAIAATPEIVERLSKAIDEAFSGQGGELGDKLQEVLGDLGDVAKRGVELVIRVAFGVAQDMLGLIWPEIKAVTLRGLNDSVIVPLLDTLQVATTALQAFAPHAMEGTFTAIAKTIELFQVGLPAAISDSEDVFARLDDAGSAWERQWLKGSIRLSGAMTQLVHDGDDLLNVSKLLAQHAMTGFDHVSEKSRKAGDDFAELRKRIREFGEEGGTAIKGWGQQVSDVFAYVAVDGKGEFDQLAKAWEKTLVSMSAQKFLFGPAFDSLGSGFSRFFGELGSSAGAGGAQLDPAGPVNLNAHGNVYADAGVRKLASGEVLTQPTYYPRLSALAGEAGPELHTFYPLKRIGQDLGIKGTASPVLVQVIDQRSSGARPEVSQQTGSDGRSTIKVLLRDEVKAMHADGSLDKALRDNFGLKRQASARG